MNKILSIYLVRGRIVSHSFCLLLALVFFSTLAMGQKITPLFKQDMSSLDIKGLKERSMTTKLSTSLLMMMDAYDKMRPGQTMVDVMPLADEFLLMRNGMVGLEIAALDLDACLAKLHGLGMQQISHYKHMINCMAPMDKLNAMKNMAGVKFIRLSYKPFMNIGAATSQGDIAQMSDISRLTFGIDGTGNTVGVLSDSYDFLGGAASDIMTGDLPGPGNTNGYTVPIQVIQESFFGGIDEGRAMHQIIHDVAPGANMAFHTAFNGYADFAQGIIDLQTMGGSNIIVDDILYFIEPYYSPGLIAQAVETVCLAGAMYFSSAGNSDRESYEGIYNGTTAVEPTIDALFGPYIGSHAFAPKDSMLTITFAPGSYIVIFQWDQPFFSSTGGAFSTTDLDLAVYVGGFLQFGSFELNTILTGDAWEGLQFFVSGSDPLPVEFHIAHWIGPIPNRIKMIVYGGPKVVDWESGGDAPTLVGHANTPAACAVGASAWFITPKFGVDPPGLNSFSSWGGVPIVFDAFGTPIVPVTYNKPEFVAPDGGNNTFFGADSDRDPDVLPNFFGTSAAAPHAAAAAALVFEAGAADKAAVKTTLETTALDMLTPGFDFGSGAGLLRVPRAVSLALGENASPNCQDINMSLQPDGFARLFLSEIVTNEISGVGDLTVLIETEGGGRVYYFENHIVTDIVTITDACAISNQKLKVTISNGLGTCWSYVTLKSSSIPFLPSRSSTVYCDDPLIAGGPIGGVPPNALLACGEVEDAALVADWITPYQCLPGVQDTLKVIIREWEAFTKSGARGVGFDTIVVLQFPEIDLRHIYCGEKDTVYCADTLGQIGPFITFDSLNTGVCDTAYLISIADKDKDGMLEFVPTLFESKCGLTVHVDYWKFAGDCEQQYKVVVELKQSCYGPIQSTCTVMPSAGTAPNVAQSVGPGYWRCEFWVTDLDTLPPVVDCKDDNLRLTTVYTGTHECAAHTYVPPAYVEDDWTGIKQVKATIEDIGTTVLTYNAADSCYEGHTLFKLPHRVLPYKVLYEAYDSCHNIGYDSCYIRVKDNTRPVPVVDKGVTVSLSDKKVWVDAETFDEGSWDNCGVNLLLARRADWYEACLDLCDDELDTCWVSEHHDTIWRATLQTDKHLDEVEAHYAKTLDWLCNDDVPCGDVLYNAWQYDLMKHATTDCVDHPYDVPDDYFTELIRQAIRDPEFAYKWKNPSTLFIGTSDFGSSDNDAYYVRMNGNATPLFDILGVWGATTDFENDRILFTSSVGGFNNEGNVLYALPFGGVEPVKLGNITNKGGGSDIRIDGLAVSNGIIYGSQQFDRENQRGIYRIDPLTFEAELVLFVNGDPLFFDSGIGGIDADPKTGKIYGSDDVNGQIVEIDIDLDTVIAVADYPAGMTDIDGVAVGGGKIFLVPDEAGVISVYDLSTGTYSFDISSPISSSDLFSGGAAYMPMLEELVDEWAQIGGGWSESVPFSCEDACGPVTVEVLVMDYWCNWSKAWTKVWVEDKTPVQVVKDVYDESNISCKTYKDKRYSYPEEIHPVSLDYVVAQAKLGEQDAFDLLDDVFGGYCKAWKDPYGNYVDIEGTEIDCDITFYDSICQCTSYYDQVRVYDDHLGYIWKDSLITHCDYYQDTLDFQKGIVVVNCEENVYCEQEVWCEFDHCGQGYIFRKFKIWQGCPDSFYVEHNVPDSLRHGTDTIYRHQRIWVGNECELDKYMFDVPYDAVVYSCNIEYDAAGNVIGDAGPENTGYATYKFDDDCRIVGIAHEDKVFKVVGGDEACYKILRTWYFADWCGYGGEPVSGSWWHNYELVIDSCVQKIIVNDTTPPLCVITGPVEDGGAIEVSACAFNLEATVSSTDSCGVSTYYWELKNITDPDAVTIVDSGNGDLSGEISGDFDIESKELAHGSYKLKVVTVDECNNEGYCEYIFDVISVKKPSPVCVTSLTARLTPWDSDGDGEIDSAHAVVWAGEFDSSSEPACQDTAIQFRIEFMTGDSTDDSAAGDADSLALGCADFGTHMVRMWVVSLPSDTRDYCDVVLIVQSDLSGCQTTEPGERDPLREVSGMQQQTKAMDGSMLTSDQFNSGHGEPVEPGIGGRPIGQNQLLEGFVLEQNTPNPFQAETSIGFVLPEDMVGSIEVYDIAGKIIRSVEGKYFKGYNQLQFRKTDLGVSGILYYRLSAGNFTSTRKMILIE